MTSAITWGIFFAVGLAALLRQYLFAHSYWYDEAFLILTIRERTYVELLGAQPYNLVVPPAFLWITRALHQIGGDAELTLRLPAFSAGVAALLLMMPLSRLVLGRTYALYAFAWLAVSRQLLLHSCEVHPYTLDLFLAELILLCTAALLATAAAERVPAWALVGLGCAAVIGPWLSLPAAFVLGGASVALAVHLWSQGTSRLRTAWLTFNGLAALSAFSLWWISARHQYYPETVEQWGARGWWGFPDRHSTANVLRWLLSRPYEIANYGTRDLGIVLAGLALWGCIATARRAPAVLVLLLAPFVMALAAALLGTYPLANRTAFFLLPCMWLLAAAGVAALVEWGRRHGRELAAVLLLLVAWDFSHSLAILIRPDPGLNYRDAYAFVRSHQQPHDAVWAQMAVVYEAYYGKDAPILKDADLGQAEQLAARERVWAVMGSNRHDLRQRFEDAGGRVRLAQEFSGVSVLLFEPQRPATGDSRPE